MENKEKTTAAGAAAGNNQTEKVLLEVKHLCQYFKMGRRVLKAVDDVSFDIKKGEVFGLVGESGCGKTTTGRSIINLYDTTSGEVVFDGYHIAAGVRKYKDDIKTARAEYSAAAKAAKKRLRGGDTGAEEEILKARETRDAKIAEARDNILRARRSLKESRADYALRHAEEVSERYAPLIAAAESEQEKKKITKEYRAALSRAKREKVVTKIQMIFQDPIASLNPRMTVREIISEGLIIKGEKNKEFIDEQVYKVLDLVGLVREHAGRYPHEFSGGQRQRIGIARSIILNPDLIIADEPISALDVSIQAQVINLLNDLREKLGLTILFIAHDLSVVKYFSDRIAVMYFGKIVELASSDELFKHPMHPYTKSLLSAIPIPDPHIEKKRKRISYNAAAEHDYTDDKPSLRELRPGHFVYCNDAEFAAYDAEYSR